MANFTKGPWSIHDSGDDTRINVRGANEEFVADCADGFFNDDGEWLMAEESAPNACLIAASPDLYDVAEMVARLNPDAGEIGEGMLAEIVDRARKAIAKADGETK